MPYRTERIPLASPFWDRRVKLLPCQKEMIPSLHERGMSIRAIARMYGVDKRLIQFILFPERKDKNLADRELRGGSARYYDKTENTKAMRDHRRYKHDKLSPFI